MATKNDLQDWIVEPLGRTVGGRDTIVNVCKFVWDTYEEELRRSGDLFYTWQYDIRWAATKLRKRGVMRPDPECPKGLWALR